MMLDWLCPRAQELILPRGEPFKIDGQEKRALGTGIVAIIGSARSGKTTLALEIMKHSSRDLCFVGLPDIYLNALPDDMKSRSSNPSIEELAEIRDSIVLLDDTAVQLNSRDYQKGMNKVVGRLAGIISHFGITLIMTVQSTSQVDVSLFRATEMSILFKRMDPVAMRFERDSMSEEAEYAQMRLREFGTPPSLYYCLYSDQIWRSPTPFSKGYGDRRSDILSRPWRYAEQSYINAQVVDR